MFRIEEVYSITKRFEYSGGQKVFFFDKNMKEEISRAKYYISINREKSTMHLFNNQINFMIKIATSITAGALGVATTAAAPVLVGAAAGVAEVYLASKVVDDVKLPDGKTIRQEVKDLYYEGAKK
jgi:hypothetical protein